MLIRPALLVLAIVGALGRSDCLTCLNRIGYGTRNSVRRFVDIKFLVDILRDRLNLCPQFLLNLVQVETIIPVNEVDRKSQVSKTSRSTNSVEVSFSVLGEIEIDDHVDGLDIDTTSQ